MVARLVAVRFGWLVMLLAYIIITLLIMLVGVAVSAEYGPMPVFRDYAVMDAGFQGHLPCGDAFMEVRRGHKPGESVVVWYLNGKVLAIVFVYDGYSQAFVDWDFNGYWNFIRISKIGESPGVREYYSKVEGCGDGWFR